MGSHIHSPTPSPTLHPIWVPPAYKSAFHRQSGRSRARRTRQRALGWKAGSLELAPHTTYPIPPQPAYPTPLPPNPGRLPHTTHPPSHTSPEAYPTPHTSYPGHLPYTSHLPHPGHPPYTPTDLPYTRSPRSPTLHPSHGLPQVVYPIPPSQPTLHQLPTGTRSPPRRPTLYPPFVACRRPASQSAARSLVCCRPAYPPYPRPPTSLPYPARNPTSKDTPSRPTLYRTRGSHTRRRGRPRPRPKQPTLHHSTTSHQRTWPRTSVPTRLPYTSRPVATCAAPTTNTTTFSP
jgi:hypothetical protein